MPILPSSLAVGVGAGVYNTNFTPSATDIARNIVVIGTINPALNGGVTAAVPIQISSAGQAGVLYGQGWMLHRLIAAVFSALGSGGATVWALPQIEVAGAAATSTTFAVTGTATAAGTLACYVGNTRYAVSVASGDAAAAVGTLLTAAITADANALVTAAGTASVACTSKSKGPWGNSIPVAINLIAGDALPAGIACAVTALSGGTGVPVIADALNGLGTGSNANTIPASGGQWMTDLVHGYLGTASSMTVTLQDQTTTTAISVYNGLANANPPTGCYDHLVGKPFRCILGDCTNSVSVPAALLSYAQTNLYDRTSAILCVPGSKTHPCEIAAIATGVISPRAGMTAERPYMGMVLPGVDPGPSLMWNGDYGNRDTAVKGGLSPTIVQGGYVVLQNIVTMYAGNTTVPSTSNGYREWANICKLQNIIASMLSTFRGPKWQGITIVRETANVTDALSRQYVRGVTDVRDELIALALAWEQTAWIYNAAFTINGLKAPGAVSMRTGGDGFTAIMPGILSGVGNIIDMTFNFDISLAGVS